jgi:hypothetical protein
VDDDELEAELRRRVRAGSRPRRDEPDDAPLPDEPYDWPGPHPVIDHPRPPRRPSDPARPASPRQRRTPPRPAQTRRRRGGPALPSIPTGNLGDVTGGLGGFGWAVATVVVGLSLVYLIVNERGNGPKGFSALVDGVATGVSLLVEPVDPLGGAGALKPRTARQRTAQRPASKPVGRTALGQAHDPVRN